VPRLPAVISVPVPAMQAAGGGPSAVEQVNLATGTITYLATDRLGSVRATVSSAGAVTGTTSYDAWGNPATAGGLTATTPVRLRRWRHRPHLSDLPHQPLLRPHDGPVHQPRPRRRLHPPALRLRGGRPHHQY
jgi:hypothetical protein